MITITYDNKQNDGRISTRFEIIQSQTKGQIYDNSLDYLSPQVRKNYS